LFVSLYKLRFNWDPNNLRNLSLKYNSQTHGGLSEIQYYTRFYAAHFGRLLIPRASKGKAGKFGWGETIGSENDGTYNYKQVRS